jgi:hypothetical protein
VIAASSVVIAVGGVWLYAQYTDYLRVQKCLDFGSTPGKALHNSWIVMCHGEYNYHGRF